MQQGTSRWTFVTLPGLAALAKSRAYGGRCPVLGLGDVMSIEMQNASLQALDPYVNNTQTVYTLLNTNSPAKSLTSSVKSPASSTGA